MTPPRISRDYMSDDELARARNAMLAYTSMLGTLQYRFTKDDDLEAVRALRRDEDAMGAVLGILVTEIRQREIDDFELNAPYPEDEGENEMREDPRVVFHQHPSGDRHRVSASEVAESERAIQHFERTVINHKDGDPRNNDLSNLELVEHPEWDRTYRVGDPDPTPQGWVEGFPFCADIRDGAVCTWGESHRGDHVAGDTEVIIEIWSREA